MNPDSTSRRGNRSPGAYPGFSTASLISFRSPGLTRSVTSMRNGSHIPSCDPAGRPFTDTSQR